MSHTVKLTGDAYEELLFLADTLGFPPDLAALYAVRLVAACYREGLIGDEPSGAWPAQARRESVCGEGARVLAFPDGRHATKNA